MVSRESSHWIWSREQKYVSAGTLIFGLLVSVMLAMIYNFFFFSVDYTRTEYVQFEDDDYYYYVKAIPKMAVSSA